jgi:hypothetical protein
MGSAPFSLQRIINDHSAQPFLISLFLFKWWGLHISGKTRPFFYITSVIPNYPTNFVCGGYKKQTFSIGL